MANNSKLVLRSLSITQHNNISHYVGKRFQKQKGFRSAQSFGQFRSVSQRKQGLTIASTAICVHISVRWRPLGNQFSPPGRHSKCPIFSKRKGLRTSNLVHSRSTKTRISDNRHDLQGQRSRSPGYITRLTAFSSCINRKPNVGTLKLVKWLPIPRATMRRSFKVKGLKVKVIRTTNCHYSKWLISHEREVRRISNLVHVSPIRVHISDNRHDLQGQRSRSPGYITRLTAVSSCISRKPNVLGT